MTFFREYETFSVQRIQCDLTTFEDPTAHGSPSFALVPESTDSPEDSDFETGVWVGTWNSRTKKITGGTALVGTTGKTGVAHEIADGDRRKVFARWNADGANEVPAVYCGIVEFT